MKIILSLFFLFCWSNLIGQDYSTIEIDFLTTLGDQHGYLINLEKNEVLVKSVIEGDERIRKPNKKRWKKIKTAIDDLKLPYESINQEALWIGGSWLILKVTSKSQDEVTSRYWYGKAPQEIKNLYLLVAEYY